MALSELMLCFSGEQKGLFRDMIHTWVTPPSMVGKSRMGAKEIVPILVVGFIYAILKQIFPLLSLLLLVGTVIFILLFVTMRKRKARPFYAYIEDKGILYYAQCFQGEALPASMWELVQMIRTMQSIHDVFRILPNAELYRIDGVFQISEQHDEYAVQCWGRPIRIWNGQPVLSPQQENRNLQVSKQIEHVRFLMQRFSQFRPQQNTAIRRR